jgi:hypothetical protein
MRALTHLCRLIRSAKKSNLCAQSPIESIYSVYMQCLFCRESGCRRPRGPVPRSRPLVRKSGQR